MDADGVGCVVQDAAGTANSDWSSLTSASTAIQRSVVNAAVSLLVSTAENSDIASFSPSRSPGVADNPVPCTVL